MNEKKTSQLSASADKKQTLPKIKELVEQNEYTVSDFNNGDDVK